MKKTKIIKIGNIKIGGGNKITVQSMVKERSLSKTIKEIHSLEASECDIVRIAIPDFYAARDLKKIKSETRVPIVADIHFNYKLAIKAIENGADKIRINPGNIGSVEKVKAVIRCAKEHKIPIRVGVNSGSLEKNLLLKYKHASAGAMVESAKGWIKKIEDMGFDKMVVSLKSSDVIESIEAYRKISKEIAYPLHLGITAASGGMNGLIRSAIGIGVLLNEGIGDTIRVSLSGPSVDEVYAGLEILRSLGLRKDLPTIIACPTCGRCRIDVAGLVKKIESEIRNHRKIKGLKIAVMGCVVNGPGEAKDADLGVSGGDGRGIIFKKGKIIKKVSERKIVDALMEELCKE